jgi:hypothetical protein
MPELALRGVTPSLHQALKEAAERNHRSLNGEVLARLEASVRASLVDVDTLLTRIDARKGRLGLSLLDDQALLELKEEGRL